MTTSTVAIVSYRPGDWLTECVVSVLHQATEVIVVDNGSEGGQASLLAGAAGARVIRSARNLGFAGGVARALRQARGDLFAVLNDDAVAGPGWIDSAAGALADPTVAAVTPKVLARGLYREVVLPDEEWFSPPDQRGLGRQLRSVEVDGRSVLDRLVGAGVHDLEQSADGQTWRWTSGPRPWYVPVPDADAEVLIHGEPAPAGPTVRIVNHAGAYLRTHGVAAEIGFGAPDDGRFDHATDVFGFSGTAPVFRTATFRQIGPFAPPFFAYNEDTDWCLRARLRGMRIAYDPAATVTHRMSATSGGSSSLRVRRLAQRNALLCLIRNGPREVAVDEVGRRLRRGPRDQVARALAAKLPWALSTRMVMRRHWVQSPEQIWDHWAERGADWDTSPARV